MKTNHHSLAGSDEAKAALSAMEAGAAADARVPPTRVPDLTGMSGEVSYKDAKGVSDIGSSTNASSDVFGATPSPLPGGDVPPPNPGARHHLPGWVKVVGAVLALGLIGFGLAKATR